MDYVRGECAGSDGGDVVGKVVHGVLQLIALLHGLIRVWVVGDFLGARIEIF
jgi:hypothetical protein